MSVVRAAERRRGGADGHRFEILTPPLPGQRAELSRHVLAPGAPTGGPGDPPMHEPGARETALVESGAVTLDVDGARHELRARRLRDLRRRPAPPLREPRPRRRPSCWPSCPRGCAAHEPARSSTRSGRPTRSPTNLLYIDLHLVHEVTSPQAFDGLRLAGRDRPPARPHAGHRRPQRARPTARRSPRGSATSSSRVQVETLERNCEEFGIPLYSLGSERQGIVHVIGPELGVTQPGMTIVCGDSHTATHGAFGALAFGIGTSEVEHVLATQCLVQRKPRLDADPLRGRAGLRRHGQGPDPRHDRPDRRRRRRRPRRRVRRRRRSRRSRWRAA